ncbi:type VI secretion system protein [Undibacterium curvum]|uniref:type VI secretion system protein n=1 Tax=Undibacterium curvum TaxID=2762294 RepID=UPI003D13DF5E
MNTPFYLIAGLATFVALLLGLLIWRARKPLKLPPLTVPLKKLKGLAFSQRWAAVFKEFIAFVHRREWLYDREWILVLGQEQAGKSSLLRSLMPGLCQIPSTSQQELVFTDTKLSFLETRSGFKGVVLDPDGKLPAAPADSETGFIWEQVLKKLLNVRPERALDAIILVISAQSLRDANGKQRLALATNLRTQLSKIEQSFQFSLPVYVVVSQTDTIVGFSEFWRIQDKAVRKEMFGWSAPDLPPSENIESLTDVAFDSIGERLKELQVQAAGNSTEISASQVDQFFLFPRHFQQLRAPLQHLLSIVFHSSAWQAGSVFRGLYFTGQISADTVTQEGEIMIPNGELPCSDIAFIHDLIAEKILAEPYLGQAASKALLSRNQLIRRFQIAGLVTISALAFCLGLATLDLRGKNASLQANLTQLQQLEQQTTTEILLPGQCIAREPVYKALEQIATIQKNSWYLSIPASWIDHRVSPEVAKQVANGVLKRVVLPGIACRLEQRAKALQQAATPGTGSAPNGSSLAFELAKKNLLETENNIALFEQNLAVFQRISTLNASLKNLPSLQPFLTLTHYAYQAELPKQVHKDQGVLLAAVLQAQYPSPVQLPDNFRPRMADQLVDLSNQLHQQMNAKVTSGKELSQQLNALKPPFLSSTRDFSAWLTWVSTAWAISSNNSNPCKDIEISLGISNDLLLGYNYPAEPLKKMRSFFNQSNCYAPNIATLSGMQLAPYGSLFIGQPDTLALNPKLASEMVGLNALVVLNFMQVEPTQDFLCSSSVAGWNATQISLSNNYVAEYDKFIQSLAQPAGAGKITLANTGSQSPLYQRIALHQLESVLNSNLRDAQIKAKPSQLEVNPAASIDLALAQESSAFSAVKDALLKLQGSYKTLGFTASDTKVSQCIRNYSSDSLARVQNLNELSRLYESKANSGGGPLFDLGPVPVINDYLTRQLSRVQVLASYATPFLSYLTQSSGPNDAQRSNTQSANYWTNTVNELNSQIQFKDPASQVAQLNNLFLKQMPNLDVSNCSKTLAAYTPADYGNDLFSMHRQKLEAQIQANCSGDRNTLALNNYNDLAARFNRELAGRYPFGPLSSSDASLSTTRNFFADYAGQSAALKQSLQGLSGAYWNAARQFLSQLDTSAKFFQSTLNLDANPPATTASTASTGTNADDTSLVSQPIKLSIAFNTNQTSAQGSSQIVAWALTSGSKSATYPGRTNVLDWAFGQATVLDLTWASGSLWLPANDAQQPDLQAEGATASYAQSGEWALLRMIERHQPQNGFSASSSNPNQLMLEFLVPIISNTGTPGKLTQSNARVYVGLNLSGKDPKTFAPVSIKPPLGFPRSAP